jgi:hypothetical protein
MSATKRAIPFESVPPRPTEEARTAAPGSLPTVHPPRVLELRLRPVQSETRPRSFLRVPTHVVGVFPENRQYPRASLKLPLRLRSVNSVPEEFPITLVTRDLSSAGVYFLCPKPLAVDTPIELEIVLVSRPMGRGNVVAVTMAHVRRTEPAAMPGWHGVAASFDDVEFDRDDRVPSRFLSP